MTQQPHEAQKPGTGDSGGYQEAIETARGKVQRWGYAYAVVWLKGKEEFAAVALAICAQIILGLDPHAEVCAIVDRNGDLCERKKEGN